MIIVHIVHMLLSLYYAMPVNVVVIVHLVIFNALVMLLSLYYFIPVNVVVIMHLVIW